MLDRQALLGVSWSTARCALLAKETTLRGPSLASGRVLSATLQMAMLSAEVPNEGHSFLLHQDALQAACQTSGQLGYWWKKEGRDACRCNISAEIPDGCGHITAKAEGMVGMEVSFRR